MPTFYSVRKGQSLELRPGGYVEVDDLVFGKQRVPAKPLVVHFRPLDPPFKVFGLPAKHGMAGGILTPEDGVAQIRSAANELGPAVDKLPESDEKLQEWLVQKLSDLPSNGSLFVMVRDADEILEGDPVDINLPRAGMMTSPVGCIVQSKTDSRAYCEVCKTSMDKRGINGHAKSNKHLANLRAYEEELKAASQVA